MGGKHSRAPIAEPYVIDATSPQIGVSIGVALFPQNTRAAPSPKVGRPSAQTLVSFVSASRKLRISCHIRNHTYIAG